MSGGSLTLVALPALPKKDIVVRVLSEKSVLIALFRAYETRRRHAMPPPHRVEYKTPNQILSWTRFGAIVLIQFAYVSSQDWSPSHTCNGKPSPVGCPSSEPVHGSQGSSSGAPGSQFASRSNWAR